MTLCFAIGLYRTDNNYVKELSNTASLRLVWFFHSMTLVKKDVLNSMIGPIKIDHSVKEAIWQRNLIGDPRSSVVRREDVKYV